MKGIFILMYSFFLVVNSLVAQQVSGLTDLDGKPVTNLDLTHQKATVFIFVSPECPLCQGYSLTLRNLYIKYTRQQVKFVAVVPGTYFTKQAVADYIKAYKIPFPVYFDHSLKVVKQFSATVTPEVFVMNANGKIIYTGRIDNWAFAPGKKRTIVTEHDLENALSAIMINKPVQVSKTKAIGCFIE